ncbi:YlaI family protein [Ferdinandcohnia quinoae]|uniref:YlaI family protein n=1 Tax=Fredinandcohnia quinoae TaxID=2918902 RepID=A0AAW5DZS5_9BACI|nr:YlaI family protein [Fredinandcohnia sp. SECRCQ15]MCH1623929.1 YlaI family protein [Fredinandcohnia sp. SECRCQ15]
MKVKCVLCDKIEDLVDESSLAKRLRNRPIHTYMCMDCHDRIEQRTNERIATNKFKLYRKKKTEDDWW